MIKPSSLHNFSHKIHSKMAAATGASCVKLAVCSAGLNLNKVTAVRMFSVTSVNGWSLL